jgi:hypothetical protein
LAQFLKDWRGYRAFKKLPRDQRRIVVFSESAQDWHHMQGVIADLTGRLGETICYVASTPDDPGLKQDNARILPFCIGEGFFRILWCQTLDADVVLTQLLDLDNLDLKRSVNRVHYVFMFHSLVSTHMADHADSYDHYDSILCAGPHHEREIRRREALAGLPAKELVPHGYARVEQLLAERREPPVIHADEDIHVLLAPSWGTQSILNAFGQELVTVLLDAGFRLTLRPHFQTRWQTPEVIDRIVAQHGDNSRFRLVEQMSESASLFDSHVMITDWSGAGMDYGFGLEKPVLYFDVPPKSRNDSWPSLKIEPFEMQVRDKLGRLLPADAIAEAPRAVRELVAEPGAFRREVEALREASVYNLGSSAAAGADAVKAIADRVAAGRSGQA